MITECFKISPKKIKR